MPVTCLDVTTADTFAECPQTIDYEEDRGWTPDPTGETGDFITGSTEEDPDSALRDIFEALGGASWFGTYDDNEAGRESAFQEWKEMYGGEFPVWTGSTYEKKSDLVQARLGLLEEEIKLSGTAADLKADALRFTKGQELENIREGHEEILRSSGGLITGEREKKVDSAYDRILKGFDYEATSQEISRAQSMIDYEGRSIGYQDDLLDIVQNYQDNMWDLIVGMTELQGGAGSGETIDHTDSCGRGPDAPDYMNPDCGTAVTDEVDEHDDPYDGYDNQDDGQGQWDNPQDQGEGFGEDIAYEDYWYDESHGS